MTLLHNSLWVVVPLPIGGESQGAGPRRASVRLGHNITPDHTLKCLMIELEGTFFLCVRGWLVRRNIQKICRLFLQLREHLRWPICNRSWCLSPMGEGQAWAVLDIHNRRKWRCYSEGETKYLCHSMLPGCLTSLNAVLNTSFSLVLEVVVKCHSNNQYHI